MASRISITGDKKIERMFRELPGRLQKKILRQELKIAADPILRDAKALAPIEEGDLRRAIKARAGKRSRNRVTRSVIVDAKKLVRAGAERGDRVAGAFQEYGTEFHPPQPFFRPAFDRNKQRVTMTARRRIGARIVQEAKRI